MDWQEFSQRAGNRGVRSPGGDGQAGREERREEALQRAARARGALGVLGAHVALAVPARRGVPSSPADVRHAHPVVRRRRLPPCSAAQ